ncbi:hypothetical protein, partial [Pseudobutyrivibrio ruminis]|uniref:hypothetical protein n=1 Tax=Pseudobutyrivibrio ruminis TaxID=46206 RepID=UPI001A9A3922
MACIEELSDYRKAGNGLKKRKTVKPIIVGKKEVIEKLKEQYLHMEEDLQDIVNTGMKNCLFNMSSLDFSTIVNTESVDGIIFSPPYANCFD